MKFNCLNKFIVVVGIFFSFNCMSQTSSGLNFPFILANGEAEIKVKPDIVTINFSVIDFNKDPNAAMQTVAKRSEMIVALAKSIGIGEDQITSAEYSKETKRKRDNNYENLDILGYEVSQSFAVSINDISLYTSFADKLIASHNIQGMRSEFKVSNEVELNRGLVKQATANAKKNAVDLADGMGVKLGSIYAVSQNHHFASLESIFGIYRGGVTNNAPDFVPPPSLDFVPDSASASMFIPKTITLTESISAVYKIK